MQFSISLARPADLTHLPAIERAAARLFPAEDLDDAMRDTVCAPELVRGAQAAGELFVALVDGAPVGFALTLPAGNALHLEELDVDPAHGRQGIGRALLDRAAAHAREAGYTAVTLTTFRHLPWNAPFYARAGFLALDGNEVSPYLRTRLDEEREEGYNMNKRVAMQRQL